MKKAGLILILNILLISSAVSRDVNLMMLFTSDEHGWLAEEGKNGGASSLYWQWLNQDSIQYKNTLILSGGDNFTGNPISTFTNGRAMQEVMIQMGYDYSALGNHEFDFGLNELNKRIFQSAFPYLAANIEFPKLMDTNKNLHPWAVKVIGGIRVGIIGLANSETPKFSKPSNVNKVKFKDYETSIIRNMKHIQNAEIKVLLTHICGEDLKRLIPLAKRYNIQILLGGHCHSPKAELQDSVLIVEGNPYFRGYARIDLTYNEAERKITHLDYKQIENKRLGKVEELDKLISRWKDSSGKVLDEVIAFNENELKSNSPALTNLILDSWLKKYQDVQIAMTNQGSVRQAFPQGNITLGTILGILPFDNSLIICEMKGSDLKYNIDKFFPFVSGINIFHNYKLSNGETLENDKYYKVIMPDFIFNNGDNYKIKEKAVNVRNTNENPRDPVIRYLRNLGTSWNKPLTKYLDFTPKSPVGEDR